MVINTKDKDWIASFGIALFVSLLFYYVNRNSVFSSSTVYYGIHLNNLYLIEFGVFIPFLLPIGLMIRNCLEEPDYAWGY